MLIIAILYQAELPPIKDGIQKPMKKGGYSDSGADIAYELIKHGLQVVTPVNNPDIETDFDWVFPDTRIGIQDALRKGANTFWLNTVLFKNHNIKDLFNKDVKFIGQLPEQVDTFDNKCFTNELLRKNDIPVPETNLISIENTHSYVLNIDFPMMIKPIRGRGSQGVSMVKNKKELDYKIKEIFKTKIYGNKVYVEPFLNGQELTITVMPPGKYQINCMEKVYNKPWCLPVVKRFNHKNGIVPYSGLVAVMENSSVLEDKELSSEKITEIYSHCVKAGELINIKAPIRIDCRADEYGDYYLFDLNMKPNMTGPSRPHRNNQDSLTLMASRKIGWKYIDLLINMSEQNWQR